MEFVLQSYFAIRFADTINDPWLDLISNTLGAFAAGAVLVLFLKRKPGR